MGEKETYLSTLALTRSSNRVYLLIPNSNTSEFVLEITNKTIVQESRRICPICQKPLIKRYNKVLKTFIYMCTNDPLICDFISNDLINRIIKCDLCSGYLIIKKSIYGKFYSCTNYKNGCLNKKKIR